MIRTKKNATHNSHTLENACQSFERHGFIFDRCRGSHYQMIRQGCARPLTIPMYSEVQPFIIIGLINTAGITRGEYLQTLKSL